MPFPRHSIDTAPTECQPALTAIHEKFGGIPEAAARQATSPRLLNGFLQANQSFEESTLSPSAREALVMTVAVRNGCETCIAIHSRALTQLGMPELIEPLRQNTRLPDPALDAIRVFAHQLIDSSGKVSDEQLQAFTDAGYTPEQALEVVFGIGVYTMSTFANRLVRA